MDKNTQRARELLAQQYDECDPDYAQAVRNGEDLYQDDTIALRAIASALSQQPEALGVVEMPGMVRELERIGRLGEGKQVWIEPSEAIAILAALTGERNG